MKTSRALISISFLLFVNVSGRAGEHRPLLPAPQEIHYGAGHCLVRGLSIAAPAQAAPEDLFAAREVARFLSEAASAPVSVIRGTRPQGARVIRLVRTGAAAPLPVPGEKPGPDSREAYSVKIDARGGEIRATSTAGLYYGAQTIRQLIEGSGQGASLPEVEVRDWAALAYRGTMIDMSHGPLPREEEVKRQIDFMSRWKANQYYFYTEASVELDGYSLLNPDGRFTKDQVRRIVAYGRERHIDVIPFLELYGHLHDLLRVETYSELGAFSHAGEIDPANPKVMAVMSDWARQFSELFPSPFVHIGFDETWQIEKAARQGATSPEQLFVRQLSSVARLFEQRGKTVMAWGDIIVKYPAIMKEMPAGLIPVAWDYDAVPDTSKRLDPLVKNGLPHFVASGVANWKEIALDFDMTFSNIDNLLADGRKSGALGLINTDWTDSSQALLRMSFPAIAYGSAAPWQSGAMDRAGFFSAYTRQMYRPAVAVEAAAALADVNRAETTVQKALGQDCFYQMWTDPFTEGNLKRSREHRADLHAARLAAESAEAHIYRALSVDRDATALNSVMVSARMIDLAAYKFLNALEVSERWNEIAANYQPDRFWSEFESDVTYQSHGRIADMMDAVTELRERYREAWLAEYTPYRLGTTLGRFDAEYEYWRRLQARFRDFTRHLGTTLPPLDSVVHGRP